MKKGAALLKDWALQDPDRWFEIRFVGDNVKYPWAVDLMNNASQQAVHVDCGASLNEIAERAVSEAIALNVALQGAGRI